MTAKMHIALFATVAALLTALTNRPAAAAPPDDILASAADVTLERYPNADDVVVWELVSVRYEADGTSETIDDEYVKVLTEKGKREHQNLSRYFTLPYSTVTVSRVEIIRPDGQVVPVDVAAQSRVMVSPGQMNSNIYNPNSKILRVGVPGLEIGDMVHIVTRDVLMKPRVPDTWSDYSVFEYTTPMKHIVYEVNSPADLPLQNIALKAPVGETVSHSEQRQGDRIVHRWEVRDVPRTYSEPSMPAMYTVVQRLLVSTIPDWRYISRWYWNLCLPHLEAVNDDMRAKVTELTEGITDRDETINTLFQFVSQQIRYMGITTEKEAPGYEPHDVCTTFDNRYGVCRDKAALLVAMFRVAGLPAYPVIIQAGPKKDEEVPQPYFNHAIVAVEGEDGGYILMDPTDENTTELLPAYLCNCSYLVAHPDGEPLLTSPIIPAEDNMLHIETQGSLDAGGTLSAETSLRFEGINDNAYRGYFSRLKPEERKRFFEGALKRRIAGATLKAYRIAPDDIQDTSELLTVHLSYEAPDFLVSGSDQAILNAPWLGTSLGYANFVLGRTGLDKRKYPLETDVACGVSESFSVTVAPSLTNAISIPEYDTIDTASLLFDAQVSLAEGNLTGTSQFKMRAVEFAPEEYLVLKQNLKDIEYERRKAPLLKVDGEATEHDVQVMLRDRVVELDDAHSWTDTYRVRKKILTYAGKKQNSELKLGFNPVWESVELADAVVTTASGDTRTVVEEEINVMDASWVGGAPRYSPGKTKVISLPGVEVGSVIDYTIVRKKWDRPFFSTSKSFASHDPVLTNRLTITVPGGIPQGWLDLTGDSVRSPGRVLDGGTYTWEAVNQRIVPKEDALPPWWGFTPTLFFSCGDWKTYAGSISNALYAACIESEPVRDATRAAVEGCKGTRAQVVGIRDYVARNIRSIGPALPNLPLSDISTAETTLTDGYGNSSDRAVLLATMLQAAGLPAELVLAASSLPQVPALQAPLLQQPQRRVFGRVLVRTEVDGATIMLGDTDQYAELGSTAHHNQPGMTLDGETFTIQAADDCRPRAQSIMDMTIDAEGTATVTQTVIYRGMSYAAFHRRFAELPPEERRRYYLELLGGLSQSAVAGSDLVTEYAAYPGTQTYTAHIPRYAVRTGDYLKLTLPGGIPAPVSLRAATRTQPLYRASLLRAETVYRITLPEGAKVAISPADLRWLAPGGMGSVTIETTVTDNRVEVKQILSLDPAILSEHDYASLLDMNRKLQHRAQRTLLVNLKAKQ